MAAMPRQAVYEHRSDKGRQFSIYSQSFIYNGEECQLVFLRDVTQIQLLQEEQKKVSMLKFLQASVSHDMMAPISNIIFFINELLRMALAGNER
jgi:hypothetical protein